MKLSRKQTYALVGVSGILAGGVFSFGFPSLLLPVFVLPYFYLAVYATKRLRHSLILSVVFFLAFYTTVLIWFIDVDMPAISGVGSRYVSLILGLCVLIMATVLTLVSMPFGFVLHGLRNKLRSPNLWPLIVVAATWVVIEWARSLAFALFLYAPEATIGDYWNFGSLGLGLTSSPFGYASRIVGMYGLSFLTVGLSLSIIWTIARKYWPMALVLTVSIILSLAGFLVAGSHDNRPKISASVFQQSTESNRINNYAPIKYKSDDPKDLIVLHEYSETFLPHKQDFASKYVTNRLGSQGVSIDVSADFNKTDGRFNVLEVRNKQSALMDTQTKGLLIPTGEYMPLVLQKFFSVTGNQKINDNFDMSRGLDKGQPPRVVTSDRFTLAPVACSGILGRNIYRALVNDGGQVLTNSASLLVFSSSQAYLRQSYQMARFHAVANDRTYIQSSKGAPAFVIDNKGGYLVPPEESTTMFIDFDFTPRSNKTIYTRFGEWALPASLLIVISFLLRNSLPLLKYRR